MKSSSSLFQFSKVKEERKQSCPVVFSTRVDRYLSSPNPEESPVPRKRLQKNSTTLARSLSPPQDLPKREVSFESSSPFPSPKREVSLFRKRKVAKSLALSPSQSLPFFPRLPSSNSIDQDLSDLYSLQEEEGEVGEAVLVHRLMKMSIPERKYFFLGMANFDHDKEKLLDTMIHFISPEKRKFEEELDYDHKEEIVKIVLLWREILVQHYRNFDPLFARKMERFLNTLEPPLSDTLCNKGMNLFFCGRTSYVARCLTSFMFQTFQRIQPDELFDGSWEKGEKYVRSPNVMAMTHNFNRISSLIGESILFCDEIPQTQTLGFMIKLASRLRKMNNFEGMAAVISGLNQSPIRRLKSLWFNLSVSDKRKFEKLDQLLSPDKNFQGYRDALKSISSQQPVLPWMALKLRELRYLYDGNQNGEESCSVVSFSHQMKIGKSIQTFLQYQENDFEFVGCDKLLLQYLRTRSVPEEKRYEKSIFLAPLQSPSP